jgi:transcriptional regulator with XRE-family HTH domain
MNISQRIKELADARGWSEYRLVKESKLAASTISNIYHRNTIPSIPTLETICNTFGISLSQFFSNDNMVSLTEEQEDLLSHWAYLSSEQKRTLLEHIKTLKQ